LRNLPKRQHHKFAMQAAKRILERNPRKYETFYVFWRINGLCPHAILSHDQNLIYPLTIPACRSAPPRNIRSHGHTPNTVERGPHTTSANHRIQLSRFQQSIAEVHTPTQPRLLNTHLPRLLSRTADLAVKVGDNNPRPQIPIVLHAV
jgi:hypothetical protein